MPRNKQTIGRKVIKAPDGHTFCTSSSDLITTFYQYNYVWPDNWPPSAALLGEITGYRTNALPYLVLFQFINDLREQLTHRRNGLFKRGTAQQLQAAASDQFYSIANYLICTEVLNCVLP